MTTSGAIAEIVIDRPERRNAVDLATWKAIPGSVAAAMANADTRVIVLRGGGDKAFVSGADISEFNEVRRDAETNREFTRHVLAATEALRSCPRPVIAQIQGYCIGGGIVLACACDIRIAADDATFAVPAAKLGLGYELENYEALARLVGHGAAAQMVMTAQPLDAQRAHQIGLVQEVVPTSDLQEHVTAIAEQITRLAPLSLTAAKASARAALSRELRNAAYSAIDACFDSADFSEGRRAFGEKRPPEFTGR